MIEVRDRLDLAALEERESRSPGLMEEFESRADGWSRALLAILGLAGIALIALVATFRIPAVDLFWQMKTGELIVRHHRIPYADVFSHTAAGHAWVVQEWLTELLFYLVYARVSPEALVFLKMAVLGVAFAL